MHVYCGNYKLLRAGRATSLSPVRRQDLQYLENFGVTNGTLRNVTLQNRYKTMQNQSKQLVAKYRKVLSGFPLICWLCMIGYHELLEEIWKAIGIHDAVLSHDFGMAVGSPEGKRLAAQCVFGIWKNHEYARSAPGVICGI